MSYATLDFSESLSRVSIAPADIDCVVAAWGGGDGQGAGAGPGWSADSVTDWAGGFLCRLKDGRYVYIEGWCDYTGWGCQDGATAKYFEAAPDRAQLGAMATLPHDWDESPADLNRWLAAGAKDPYGL